jgi:transcriptional regulator with XRE-family HTH domain
MAAMLGMPYQQIQKYEAGQLRVSAVKLRQIAQALGINISELVDDASAPGMDDLGIFELYATLDANDQNFIRSLVTRLARERPT